MSIIRFTNSKENAPSDARESTSYPGTWIWETHKNLCLEERERNMHDDSDFYMVVWNEEKNEPQSIMFATTRGWTYPAMGSFVDASPDVRAKYTQWKADQAELARERAEANAIAKIAAYCKDTGLTREQYDKLDASVNVNLYYKLLKSGNKDSLRSDFRKSMYNQVMTWLMNKENTFRHPLSAKQESYL
jgi:hypothetical protein